VALVLRRRALVARGTVAAGTFSYYGSSHNRTPAAETPPPTCLRAASARDRNEEIP